MKINFVKIFTLFAIFLLLISIIINFTSVLKTQESPEEKVDVDESNEPNTDQIFEIIEKINESLLDEFLYELTLIIGPRRTGTTGCEIAAEYIFEQFEKMGLETRYQEWESMTLNLKRLIRSKNVVATLPGKGELSDEVLILNAHFDTVKDTPGAVDDGAGTVAVLAAAYILSQYEFNRTIKFIAFSGEEMGLLGSRAYVNEIYENDPDILVEFNVDGVGYATTDTYANNIYLSPTVDARWICEEIKTINRNYDFDFNIRYGNIIEPGGPRSYTSDFFDFVLHGYEAIAFWGSEPYPYLHTPADTYDKVNLSHLTDVTKLIAASLAHLADYEVNYPYIKISAPRRGRLYFRDLTLLKFNYERTIVIDDFLIRTEVKLGDSPIEKVKFYYDNKLVFTDTDMPYQWRLNKLSIRKHTVRVILYDEKGRTAEDEVTFRYINFLRII